MSTISEINRINQAKSDIKTSLNAKGLEITDENISQYSMLIDKMSVGTETPIATTTVAGKVMIGNTMSVTETGVLNVANPIVLEGFTILTTDWVKSGSRYVYTKEVTDISNLSSLSAIVYFDRETVLSSTNRIVPETVGTNLLLWIDSLPTIDMVVEQIIFKVGGI